MEKVFLRVYNREIGSMIEGGQLDEAVAHCQHILKTFPMHIETYRLLGKAFLEGRRYADAADIFQRILMSVPDDFMSQVGMSIIRDNEGRLDDAIWHMERAFEVQPSNATIQGELRHLYGRRDGVEPPKIRLSRDALANMYLQGELFNQAIAEIRSILAEDPNRPDLQVMLLRAYYRSGQKVEATELAASLLKKYHYCMDALSVLVDLLPGTTQADHTQVYRRRLLLLDPYSSFAIESAFASAQVVDSAVDLERLDYRPSLMPGLSQTDRVSSLGIKMNPEKRAEPAPDLMQTTETVKPSGAVIPEPSVLEAPPAENAAADSVPDGMRSSGQLVSTGEANDGAVNTGEVLPEKPIAKLVIPDWLMPMAPTESLENANSLSEEPSGDSPAEEDSLPEWLNPKVKAEGAEGAQVESQIINSSPEIREDIRPIAPDEPAKETFLNPQESIEPQPSSGEVIQDTQKSMVPAEAAGTSNIVSEPTLADIPPVESGEEPIPAETPPADAKPFPDWLTGVGAGAAAIAPSAAEIMGQPAAGGEPVSEQPVYEQPVPEQSVPVQAVSDQPILEQSISEQPASEQPVPSEPATQELAKPLISEPVRNPPETLPREPLEGLSVGTLASTSGQPIEEAIPVEAEVQPPSEPTAKTVTQPDVQQPASGEEDMMAWLERLSADQEKTLEVRLESPAASGGDVPDFLNTKAPAGAAGEPFIEPQEPAEPQLASGEAIQDSRESTVPAEAAGTSNVMSEPMLPDVPPVESGAEPTPAKIPPADAKPFPDWLTGMGAGAAAVFPSVAETMAQPAAGGQPVPEQLSSEQQVPGQPVTEQPVPEQPGAEVSLPELAVLEKPVVEQLVSEQPVPEQPVSEQPVAERALPEQSVFEQPVPDQPAHEQPISEQPIPSEPAVEELVAPLISEPVRKPPETLHREPLEGLSAGNLASTSGQPSEEAIPVEAKVPPPSEPPGRTATQQVVQQPARGEEDVMVWREQQSADHETTPGVPLVSPEGNLEATPDVNREMSDEQPAVHAGEESVPGSIELEEMVEDASGKTSVALPHEEEPAMPEEESPDWIKGLESPTTPVETPKADGDMPGWLRHPIPSGGDIPDFLKFMVPSTVAGEAFIEPQEPVEPQPASGEAIQESRESTVPAEAAGTSNVVSEPMLPNVPPVESGAEPTPAEIPPADAKPFPDWLTGIGAGAAIVTPSVAVTMAQPAAGGQPVPGQIASEQQVPGQPVTKQPVPEQPVPEQPVVEQLVPEQPLSEHPVSEQTIPEQPVLTEPADQELVRPLISEPVRNPLETLPLEPLEGSFARTLESTSGQPIEEVIPVKEEVPTPSEPTAKTVTQPVDQPARGEDEDWLKELETPVTPAKTPKVGDYLPERPHQPISNAELESTSEPEASAWVDENIPVTGQAIPTLPGEWVPAEEKPDAGLEPVPIPETAPVDETLPPAGSEPSSETTQISEPKQAAESTPVAKPSSISVQIPLHPSSWKQIGKLSTVPVMDKDAGLLSSAQTFLDQDSLNESMNQYSKLIKKGQLLDEVIHDLREGLHRYPVDMTIWQTLGDAYMRANRLQDALDAYTKAEELLR